MLTNEEKINLRERALRLANELFNLPFPCLDSLRAEAEDIYGFLSKDLDDDPFKLDTPSPCNGNCGMNYCNENGCIGKKEVTGSPVPTEIDWSRPQLVKHNENGRVIKTTGEHRKGRFAGDVVSSGNGIYKVGCKGRNWGKDMYAYHGEIPQEQQEVSKTTDLIFPAIYQDDILATDWQIIEP